MKLNKRKFIFSTAFICLLMYLFQPSIISGNSMEPTLRSGQIILCEKADFIAPDDLVLYKHKGRNDVKRVVGRPYDYITIQKGVVFTNGYAIAEQFDSSADNGTNIQLVEDEYFLLGDNRTSSIDSRVYGPIKLEAIQSRVYATVHPVIPMFLLFVLLLICIDGKFHSPLFWMCVRILLVLAYPIWVGLNLVNGTPLSCSFREQTDLLCPGCGLTTMFLALLRFDLMAALSANPFFLLTSPLSAYLVYKFIKNEELKRMWPIVLFSVLILLWWLLRNYI